MSNVITDWRKAVMAKLTADLTASNQPFTVIAGERDGASRDRNLACVYAPTIATDSGNVNFARPVLIVRAWVKQPKPPKPTSPQDPEPVEQLMIDLAVCLQQIQKQPGLGIDGLYFFATAIVPDYDDWGVQATLQAWTGNPAVLA